MLHVEQLVTYEQLASQVKVEEFHIVSELQVLHDVPFTQERQYCRQAEQFEG